jgi:2-polyprenyl-3-methyl-5-hydroxy-6-metoxy-1,4-benzoquinol methylase
MNSRIFETLKLLGLSSEETCELYSNSTRDVSKLKVYKDTKSGIIFIDDFYTGEETYRAGEYRNEELCNTETPDLEKKADASRRSQTYKQFYIGKDIIDFGCGAGDFLRLVKNDCMTASGIELQKSYSENLNNTGIKCSESLTAIEDNSIDSIFSFHTLEHLPSPIEVLQEMRVKLRNDGCVVVEVPHANDFLLSVLENISFKNFTLWSQHLILHTRHSLRTLLNHCGFCNIVIEGVQRYPLSNHLHWLSSNLPGGHKSKLSLIDDEDLKQAYASALNRIDATDTLIAIGFKR